MNDLPPLNALRAFEVVFRTGGIRAAARELSISHSSVSHHVGELEAWLGAPLFHRSGGRRNLEPTFAGQQLGRAARDAFSDVSRTAARLRSQRRRNEVIVSTSPSFATRWLLPRLHRFSEKFPKIEISVRVDQRVTDFTDNPADLALRMGQGKWAGLDAVPIMDDQLFPVMSPDLQAQVRFLPADQILRRYPLLHDLDPDTTWARWIDEFGPRDLDLSKGPQITSSDLLLRAAVLRQGVALARAVLVADDIESGLLRRLSAQSILMKNAYWLVTPPNRTRPSYVTHFIDWVLSEAEATNASLAQASERL